MGHMSMNKSSNLNNSHIPVLLQEVLEAAKGTPHKIEKILDCTFGRGGHSKALLELFPEACLVAADKDLTAIEYGQINFEEYLNQKKLKLINQDYSNLESNIIGKFDFILLDLGVSSPQLDDSSRGFSFYYDGPLDMRMDQNQELNAEFIINEYSEAELLKVFKELGEVQKPFRVVRAIINDRKTKRFTGTKELSSLIERVDGWRIKGHHPATRYFMALRLEVNKELDGVSTGITNLITALNPGGRMAVITFHSLEDRIVKYIFKDHNLKNYGININKKVIIPTDEEINLNSRSRSAKLRIFQKN